MSKNGSKSKKNRTQKLIIPKGTLDNNDTTVIEIPSQYRSQEIVIAKKSNISSYSSKIDQSINTYSSDRGYHQSIAPCGRQMETASQTPYDESDIEKLMEDLEAYYHAQKNFLIKSSTLLRKQMDECQNQKTPSMCSCNQQNSATTSYTPAVFLMKKVCSQENISSCSFEGQCRKKEAQPCTRSWGRNESPRMNMSGSYYNPDLSMSRNITQYSNNSNNPQSFVNKSTSGQTNDSFWPRNENSPFESTAISDPHYDLFREGISRNADVSRSQYGAPSTTATSSQLRFDTTNQPPNRSILKSPNMDDTMESDGGNYSINRQMESFR
ncbi:uncharacterized protein LOC130891261 isoform X2 [Diorhabda carinulata]|uniref:uncharacterized protein LOC130891261 isoform X2 n=1 Tax=Diorhabda carinulata TaxID=1163345 RepID=UPI0025A04F75|nr:uncharacterized protein LOC130891261 isoform X2 [Diorhabda carinulata]